MVIDIVANDETLATAHAHERLTDSSAEDASVHVEFGVNERGLLLSGLVLQLRVKRLDLLLLLLNQLVALIHLQLSFELLFLEQKVILLDFVENLLSFLFPLEIKLLEIINFFQLVLFLQFIVFDLSVQDLQVDAGLCHFLVMFAVIFPVGVVQSLELLVELSTFDLIISN